VQRRRPERRTRQVLLRRRACHEKPSRHPAVAEATPPATCVDHVDRQGPGHPHGTTSTRLVRGLPATYGRSSPRRRGRGPSSSHLSTRRHLATCCTCVCELTGLCASRACGWTSASSRVGGVFIVSKVRIHWFLLRMWVMSSSLPRTLSFRDHFRDRVDRVRRMAHGRACAGSASYTIGTSVCWQASKRTAVVLWAHAPLSPPLQGESGG
jgi:hypothetical protein